LRIFFAFLAVQAFDFGRQVFDRKERRERDGRKERHYGPGMRVIAGKYRRRRLRSLRGLDLRPTADRLRETLFNVLTAGNPEALAGSVWLDLYAGTGAVGIEAMSRGASKVYFVESASSAVDLVLKNLQSLAITAGFEVVKSDAVRALRGLETRGMADYVFLDPPYRMESEYRKTLEVLSQSPLIGDKTAVVAEHLKKFEPGEKFGRLRRYRKLEQGDAALSFYRATE
jgi:16S rRNA (guanine(966)-N(2))-methyltransferase RsmD